MRGNAARHRLIRLAVNEHQRILGVGNSHCNNWHARRHPRRRPAALGPESKMKGGTEETVRRNIANDRGLLITSQVVQVHSHVRPSRARVDNDDVRTGPLNIP